LQENSNDYELAGPSEWLPDPSKRGVRFVAIASPDAGARRSTATASVISSVAITQGAQRASVRVEGEGRLDARAARMQNPDRLVLDFAGTRLAVQRR